MTLFLWQGTVIPAEGHLSGAVLNSTDAAKVTSLKGTQVTVNKGDTLWAIAQKYNTTVEEIVKSNRVSKPDRVFAGQKLWITSRQDPIEVEEPKEKEIPHLLEVRDSKPVQTQEGSTGTSVVEIIMGDDEGDLGIAKFAIQSERFTQVQVTNSESKPVKEDIRTLLYTFDQVESSAHNSSRGQEHLASKAELELLARVIYAEARGENFDGQVAVGAVVLNRLKDPAFPKTIREVIYQPGAFTAVNDKQIHLTPDERAFEAARAALAGMDPTGGAIYYYNPLTATDRWIKTRPVIKKIGNHTFSI